MTDDFNETGIRSCPAHDLASELLKLLQHCNGEIRELGRILDDDGLAPSDRALYERYYARNKALLATATRCQDQVQAAIDALLNTWRTTDDPMLEGLMEVLDTHGTLVL